MDTTDVTVSVDESMIEGWYFVPYTDAPGFSPDNPLYALVGVSEDLGAIMVYDRPGAAGAYHSADPNHGEHDQFPPSDEFTTALSAILSNPGETQDISGLVDEMHPWEHHQLEMLLTALNESPELLPPEANLFINSMLSDKLSYQVDEDADSTHFGKLVSEEGEHYLQEIMQNRF